jgi:hypothetical protein
MELSRKMVPPAPLTIAPLIMYKHVVTQMAEPQTELLTSLLLQWHWLLETVSQLHICSHFQIRVESAALGCSVSGYLKRSEQKSKRNFQAICLGHCLYPNTNRVGVNFNVNQIKWRVTEQFYVRDTGFVWLSSTFFGHLSSEALSSHITVSD